MFGKSDRLVQDVERWLDRISACTNVETAEEVLSEVAEHFGFAYYSHINMSEVHKSVPQHFTNIREDWARHYLENRFVVYDPVVDFSRHTTLPFRWNAAFTREQRFSRGRPSMARKIFRDAADFSLTEGIIFPFRFYDGLNRPRFAITALIWNESLESFDELFENHRHILFIIISHWQEHISTMFWDLVGEDEFDRLLVTEREKEVMSWLARGLTAPETAEVLGISYNTVREHIRAVNKKSGCATTVASAARLVQAGIVEL